MGLKATINDALERAIPKTWMDINILRHNRNYGPEFWVLPNFCGSDAVSIDVGGNRGFFAYYMARLSREVHVFEPNPMCLAQLARLKRSNMLVHEVALSDRAGMAEMRFDPENTGVGTIESANTLSGNAGIKQIVELRVPIRTLDSFGLNDVAFLKIDVEGHEPAVLRGARDLLASNRPSILVELELRHNPTVFEAVWSELDPLGYDMRACTRSGLTPVDRSRIADLQRGGPDTNRAYVNNFVFTPH
jgi:FkbM family methyltransferase